jgi:hypothetical protein
VYAEAIASLIDNELTDTPITIAITAPWGGGKTSVAKMVRRRLDERMAARGNERPVAACWFDAWMHNDAPHLGAALATTVARTANRSRPRWRRLVTPVPSAMLRPHERSRRRLALALAAAVVAALVVFVPPLGEPLLKLKAIKDSGAADAGPFVTSALLALLVARSAFGVAQDATRFMNDPGSEAARGSMAEVRQQLATLIDQARNGGRFVIYIDDLERCTPERAIEVCEITSQLLTHEGVVTVLVADMNAVAAAAAARFARDEEGTADIGRRFLEKIVQIQVALPAPHRDHMRRLLHGDPPDEVFRRDTPEQPDAEGLGEQRAESLLAAAAETIVAAGARLGRFLAPVAVAVAVAFIAQGDGPVVIVIAAVGLPLFVIGAAQTFLWRRALLARRERRLIRQTMRKVLADQPTQDELEQRVLDSVPERYEELALNELEAFRFDNTAELRRVTQIIVRYPPDLPRGAKRMLNHARLLTQIARDRRIFGGDPELTPEHLGEWIVLSERWPRLARRTAMSPRVIAELESADDLDKLREVLTKHELECPDPADDLLDLLGRKPSLSTIITRLVHFEPIGAGTHRAGPVTPLAGSEDQSSQLSDPAAAARPAAPRA